MAAKACLSPSIYGINPGDEELSAHVRLSFKAHILIGEEEVGRRTEGQVFPNEPAGKRDKG